MFVARHLQTLIEAGDDPPTADLDPDADAVAVLTVHKAKGLEFPVVYLPGLVAGRFPGDGRGEPLALPAGLGRGEPLEPERAAAPRSAGCSTSAMTRARDELVLSHAADYGGARARRVSPFVLEALDLPAADGAPGRRGRRRPAAGAAGGLRGDRPPVAGRARARSTEPLSLSFYQVDDYLTCPLQVQVRPRAAGPDGAAPRADLRLGAPQGGPGLPPAATPAAT